jgi:molecular chaperone GrpE
MKEESIEKLQKKIQEIEKERDEFLAGWQRAKADLANYKKEEKEGTRELIEYARQELLFPILSVVDNLDRAEKELKEEEKDSRLVQGFLHIARQLREFLKNQGIQEIDAAQKDFNPTLHEAIDVVEGEKSGKVAEVAEKGYMMKEKLLRPAKVKVIK